MTVFVVTSQLDDEKLAVEFDRRPVEPEGPGLAAWNRFGSDLGAAVPRSAERVPALAFRLD